MKIEYEDIELRDMTVNDIDDIIRWNTVDTEWMDWDAPCTVLTNFTHRHGQVTSE